ncbi:MAG: class IIb bacteriocin, lactobin A/cerein 7B family [Christensenellaceae bacterium]|nr:class IIb bacteriocin, lactobin A/cerein 7B family [Christensenellaceae bacterium]MBR3841846.1 class IIb bacteriocin, lactobin A/cerein 7B family [Christensenellaceae bacterium]
MNEFFETELNEEELEETNGGLIGIAIAFGGAIAYLAGKPKCIYPVRRR